MTPDQTTTDQTTTDQTTAGQAPDAGERPGRIHRIAGALRRHPFRVASAVCILVAAAFAAANPAWTSRQAALSLGAQPALYSELFFTNITALPVHSLPGVSHNFDFTIVNREGKTFTYHYVVTMDDGGAISQIDQGNIAVPNARKVVVVSRFVPTGTNSLYTVTVKINVRLDSIEFHGHTT